MGFPSTENLTLVRLRSSELSLEFCRQPAVMQEIELQMSTDLRKSGYLVFRRAPSDLEWRTIQEKPLMEAEARVGVETREICIRLENEMGLYETRTGKAVVVRVETGG